jgi:uncharacterized protein involved in response to NO
VTFSATIGWLPAALIDGGFLLLMAAAAAREIMAGRNWGNLKVVALIGLLAGGNIAFHLEAHFAGTADTSTRIGLAAITMLITLIGGRIVPSFTRNWLVRENPGRLPAPFGRLDMVAIAASGLALGCWIAFPSAHVTGIALIGAGLMQTVRLARWAGERTLRDRLVLILHLGYAFIPLGFLLSGAAAFEIIVPAAGIHAWAGGAVGTMTLAVMTRASLGHTGRALNASFATQAIYAAVVIAALARIAAAIEPAHHLTLVCIAGGLWGTAFLGFGVAYGPILVTARGR